MDLQKVFQYIENNTPIYMVSCFMWEYYVAVANIVEIRVNRMSVPEVVVLNEFKRTTQTVSINELFEDESSASEKCKELNEDENRYMLIKRMEYNELQREGISFKKELDELKDSIKMRCTKEAYEALKAGRWGEIRIDTVQNCARTIQKLE